ncbi:hypothetical protein KJ603_01150 [Patescibacteria group bacterium]|nr:hypothetical protein [Patescibacteria group bacterium]
MNFIQNLKNKSENQKKIILFFTVFFLMVLVFIIWFFQFKGFLEKKEIGELKENLIPVLEIKDNLVNSYKNILEEKEIIGEKLEENE